MHFRSNPPLLLKNYGAWDEESVSSKSFYDSTPPFIKPLDHLINNGIVNIDKPMLTTCYQMLMWVKKILNLRKIGQFSALKPFHSGCMTFFLGNSSCLISSCKKKKSLIWVVNLEKVKESRKKHLYIKAEKWRGKFLNSIIFSVRIKRQINIQRIYSTKFHEFDNLGKKCILEISCSSDMNSKFVSLCLSSFLKVKCKISETRQIREGFLSEKDNQITLHDLLDAEWFYQTKNNEFHLRKSIMPIDILLTCYKRIIIKETSISSVCYGSGLTTSGIIRFEKDIKKGDMLILVTLKGEAVSLAVSKINFDYLKKKKSFVTCNPSNILMKKNAYPKKWNLNICPLKKKVIRIFWVLFFVQKRH